MSHQTRRAYKTNWIMARVHVAEQQKKVLDETKLLAEFCLEFAAAERYAKEILKVLADAGRIVRVAGFIETPEQFALEKELNNQSDDQEKLNSENKT